MTKKNEPSGTSRASRDDLVAQLEALDKADEVSALKQEIEDLKAHAAALVKERDIAIRRNRDLEKSLKAVHTALKPVAESLETGSEIRRGRVYSPERMAPLREAAARSSQAYSAAHRVTPKGLSKQPTDKQLAAIFPELNGPSSEATEPRSGAEG